MNEWHDIKKKHKKMNTLTSMNKLNAFLGSFLRNNLTTSSNNKEILIELCKNKKPNLIKHMITKYGWDKYIQGRVGNIFHVACKYDDLKMVKFIIQHFSYDLNIVNSAGDTGFHVAANCGSIKVLKYLLDSKYFDINALNDYGANAYHCAAAGGDIDIMIFLEKQKINIFHKDTEGWDALIYAADSSELKTVKYLCLKFNWNYKTTTKSGETIADLGDDSIGKYYNKKNLKQKFKQIDKSILPNVSCGICLNEFQKNENICKCHNNHVVHKKCYMKHLNINNIFSNFECIICKDNVINCTFSYNEHLVDNNMNNENRCVNVDNVDNAVNNKKRSSNDDDSIYDCEGHDGPPQKKKMIRTNSPVF